MKKIKYLIISLITFISFNFIVEASGTATLTVSSTTIQNGHSVNANVRITNTAAWNISISSAGATSGCSQKFVGDSGTGLNITRTFTVTCRATSTGIISFTLSGDITSSNGSNVNVSGSRSVTVIAPIPKSTNNYLGSLSVEQGELSPVFDKGHLEYSVELEPETKSIDVKASLDDSKARLTGTGKVEVEEGLNTINVVVTAENGSQRTYVIKAIVKEYDPIVVNVGGEELNVVRKTEEIEIPSTFTLGTVTIDEEEVPALHSDITGSTLVALKNSEGIIGLYIYDEAKETYKLYYEAVFDQVIIYPKTMPEKQTILSDYEKYELELDGNIVEAYKLPGSQFSLIYGLNILTNEEGLYLYDSKENTVQRYYTDEQVVLNNETDKYHRLFLTTGAASIAFGVTSIGLLIFMVSRGSRRKKNEKVQE